MKRILFLCLLTMCLALTACSGGNEPDKVPEKKDQSTEQSGDNKGQDAEQSAQKLEYKYFNIELPQGWTYIEFEQSDEKNMIQLYQKEKPEDISGEDPSMLISVGGKNLTQDDIKNFLEATIKAKIKEEKEINGIKFKGYEYSFADVEREGYVALVDGKQVNIEVMPKEKFSDEEWQKVMELINFTVPK